MTIYETVGKQAMIKSFKNIINTKINLLLDESVTNFLEHFTVMFYCA